MSEPLLEVDSLDAGYHGQRVLRNISFGVPDGGLITIIGPNGHGKTTLLRAVSGLIHPMAGEIRFDGKALGRARVDQIVARGIVHIPQGDMIFSEMSVRDNLMMGAYLPVPFRQADANLKEVYALLPRLKERESQTASTLSGGERRMLAIGRGMMTGGRILLIDEPSLGPGPHRDRHHLRPDPDAQGGGPDDPSGGGEREPRRRSRGSHLPARSRRIRLARHRK